jgi:imidazoleglycerol-phosphate dehydratase
MKRTGEMTRQTRETQVRVSINLDGKGNAEIETGIGFFNHMLETLSRHSFIDITIEANGDLNVDDHHTIEDVGLCVGQSIAEALGDKKNIHRFGWALCPMDEALVRAAIDLSGRPLFVLGPPSPTCNVETLQGESIMEFFKAMADGCRATLHLDVLRGHNKHHVIEALFKASAKALSQAITSNESGTRIPSTKGVL